MVERLKERSGSTELLRSNPMPGHNGYGATGSSGRLPKATVHLNVPTLPRGLIKFAAQVKMVPHSSVVGSSISVQDETGKMVALLTILVPNPDLDYKTTAKTVGDAICAALKG